MGQKIFNPKSNSSHFALRYPSHQLRGVEDDVVSNHRLLIKRKKKRPEREMHNMFIIFFSRAIKSFTYQCVLRQFLKLISGWTV